VLSAGVGASAKTGVPMDDAMIEALVVKYPLPSGVSDVDMNQTELAGALNTTLPTLTKWLSDETFPMIEQGGLGKPYVLRLSQCYAWRMDQQAQQDVRQSQIKDAQAKMQASFLNIDVSDPAAGMTTRQRREAADADYAHSRAASLRRQLVRTDEVRDLLDSLATSFREGLSAMPDRLERELSLTPEQVEVVALLGRDILVSVSERIEAANLTEVEIAEIEVSNRLQI